MTDMMKKLNHIRNMENSTVRKLWLIDESIILSPNNGIFKMAGLGSVTLIENSTFLGGSNSKF